jgi:hypothetical protein
MRWGRNFSRVERERVKAAADTHVLPRPQMRRGLARLAHDALDRHNDTFWWSLLASVLVTENVEKCDESVRLADPPAKGAFIEELDMARGEDREVDLLVLRQVGHIVLVRRDRARDVSNVFKALGAQQ